ncbi:MAG: hypothetical protein M3323_02015 [Actinomycetota bacterium]|nr:hypothetical protein [Actinomycetota bacterium]
MAVVISLLGWLYREWYATPVVGLRESVSLAGFAYEVLSFDCETRQTYQSCKARVDVVNESDQAAAPYVSYWFVRVGDDEFESETIFLRDLFPGHAAEGAVVFRLPLGVRANRLVMVDVAGGVFPKRDRTIEVELR